MAKHRVSFVELHGPLFMQGSNLGNKINAAQKGAIIFRDDDRGAYGIYFKNKFSWIECANVATSDMMEMPEDVTEFLGLNKPAEPAKTGPVARARAKAQEPAAVVEYSDGPLYPPADPNDLEAAAAHKARVRAASANSNRPMATPAQNDLLVQESRALAMGIKHHKTAQVSTAHEVGAMASVSGKPKAINHEQLKAQVAREMKE